MVSTANQYITDFVPATQMEPGKSPLAMLAKTCETIGLPDAANKKSSPVADKKEEKKFGEPGTSSSTKAKSPRATPSSKEPTMTFPGLPKPAFPMGMSPMPFPFYNPMMGYPMPFPFPMAPMPGARMPCPFAIMRQPCMTPGCVTCPTSNASQMTPEMMAFASHPLFSAYSSMMPSVSGASPMPSYQSLLAASAAAASTNATATPDRSTSPKHSCNWMEGSGVCGKKFATEEELANHVKSIHTPSPPSSASSVAEVATSSATKTPVARPSQASQFRFNPYGKPGAAPPTMPPMGMPMMPMFPGALQAMYTQRMMSSMQHP